LERRGRRGRERGGREEGERRKGSKRRGFVAALGARGLWKAAGSSVVDLLGRDCLSEYFRRQQ
jgi:hypothetical protein